MFCPPRVTSAGSSARDSTRVLSRTLPQGWIECAGQHMCAVPRPFTLPHTVYSADSECLFRHPR